VVGLPTNRYHFGQLNEQGLDLIHHFEHIFMNLDIGFLFSQAFAQEKSPYMFARR